MEPVDAPGLEVDEDPEATRASGRVETAGRWFLAAVVVAALCGVLGGAGPLVRADAADGPLAVRFDRFARLDAPLALDITLPPGDSAFVLSGGLSDHLQVEGLSPSATSETAVPEGVRYTVLVEGGPSRVRVHARPLRFGVVRGAVVAGGRRVAVRHLVYP